MRNMTVKARVTLHEIDTLQARRKLLDDKRHSVHFYGGWVSVDNVTGKAQTHETMSGALDQAEKDNA